MTARRMTYHGLLLDEYHGETVAPIDVDIALYMTGWETRTATIAERGHVRSKKSIVLSFSDARNNVSPATHLPNTSDSRLEEAVLGSHYEILQCIARLLGLFESNPDLLTGRVFLDVTCMPKLMMQWLVLELLKAKMPTELILGYVSGEYQPRGDGSPIYDQGVQQYVPIPHSCGGGVSTRRACIAALGADERLVSDYFENEAGFDRYFLVASAETAHSSIAGQVKHQIDSLRERHFLDSEAVAEVAPYAFTDCVDAFETFIRQSAECDAWDVFCSGPKPHAIAACMLALRHRSVRLIGRVPREYDQSDVKPGKAISFLRIVDLTNPRVATIASLDTPFRPG